MGGFRWKHNTAERKLSRRLLECVEENVPQGREPGREGALLAPLFRNTGGRVGDGTVRGRLGRSDHKMIVFHFGEVGSEGQQSCYPGLLEGRKAKAQLDPHLASAIKDNKKCLCKYLSSRRVRENLHPSLDTEGNREMRKRPRNAVCATVFYNQTSCSPDAHPLDLEDGGEQNEAPIIQGEMVNDLLHHLQHTQVCGATGILVRTLRELAEAKHPWSWLTSHLPSFPSSRG